jgi:hypothetical protein
LTATVPSPAAFHDSSIVSIALLTVSLASSGTGMLETAFLTDAADVFTFCAPSATGGLFLAASAAVVFAFSAPCSAESFVFGAASSEAFTL